VSVPLLDLHDLGLRQTGNETWARSLSRALFEHDGPGSYDVAVTREVDGGQLARLPAGHVERVSTSSLRRLLVDLPAALRRRDSTALLVQYTAPVTRVPSVVAIHDLSFEDPRARDWLSPAQRARFRATIRASVHRAAHLLALSGATRDDLVRRYGVDPARVTVAPAAVDPSFAERLVAGTRPARSGPATVLVVGNLVPRKNALVVARAVRLLRDRGADVRLRVVGRVPPAGRREAEEVTRLLGDAVELSGFLGDDDLAGAYLSADVLAFPSWYEGFGIPLVEAMTAGTPVVASDRTSLPEVVGDAGLVVPADDPEAWATALAEAVDPDRGAVLATLGRERALTFTWTGSAATVSQVLHRVARPPAG
jgi:glycosyltransferase involved in cell wall biosynthesis